MPKKLCFKSEFEKRPENDLFFLDNFWFLKYFTLQKLHLNNRTCLKYFLAKNYL